MKVLPRGYFEFKSGTEVIKGRMGTWSLNRFCDRMSIPNITQMYEVLTTGVSIQAIAIMLLSAVEYTYVKDAKEFPFTEIDAFDWIDDMGGLSVVTGMVGTALVNPEAKEAKGEKKRGS